MKRSNPKSRFHLNINKTDRVLEVGSGHNPHPRANVVVDKFIDSNYHRTGDISVLGHQEFIEADGCDLPFKDNEFDYIICCQVLEHVENPEQFLKEHSRVAKHGYIETPSLIGEHLFPKESHIWLILEIEEQLVLVSKDKTGFKPAADFGNLFLEYLPAHSLGYKIMQRTHPLIQNVGIEWEGSIECIVNPNDPEVLRLFHETWKDEDFQRFMPQRSLFRELLAAAAAFSDIAGSVFKSRVLKKR